jgi:hypothetical protein
VERGGGRGGEERIRIGSVRRTHESRVIQGLLAEFCTQEWCAKRE